MSLRSVLARNTAYNAAGRLWEALSALVLMRYIVERVGVPAYGLWALLGAFSGYVALFDFGVSASFAKYIAEHAARGEKDDLSSVVSTGTLYYIVLGGVVLAVGWPCAGAIVELFHWSGLLKEADLEVARFLFQWSLALFAASNCIAPFTSVQTGLQQMGVTNVLSFAASLVKIAATIVFLEWGYGLRGLIFAQALALAFFGGASVTAAFRFAPGLKMSLRHVTTRTFRRLFGFGIQTQVARASNLVMMETDKVVAGLLCRDLGLIAFYDLGVNLANKMRQIPLLLLSAVLPAASHLDARDEHEQLRRLYLLSTKYVAAVAIPLALFTAAAAGLLMRVWMGPSYETSAWVLRIIALGYLANILPGAGVSIALGKGRADLQMKAGIIATAANILLTVVLVLVVGFWGIPIGTALSMVIAWAWFARAVRPVIGIAHRELFGSALLWPLVAALPGCVGCLALDWGGYPYGDIRTAAAVLLMAVGAFGASYLLIIRRTPFITAFDIAFMKDTLHMKGIPGFAAWAKGCRHA